MMAKRDGKAKRATGGVWERGGAWFAAGTAFVVYAATLAPGLTEVDSGELSAVAATLGVAHPSGYPLFALLGRAWTSVVTFAPVRVIFATNLLSAVLAAAAVGMLYRTIRDLLAEGASGGPGGPGGRGARVGARAAAIGAGTAALAFGFHRTLWSVATITEVHALQMFLDTALLHAMVRAGLWGRGRFKESAWLVGCYLGGLCLTNHLTSGLLLPAFLLGTWGRRRDLHPRLLIGGVALGVLALSVYSFLPIRAAQLPYFNWGAPDDTESFFRHVTGAQYRVWMFASGEAFARNAAEFGRELVQGYGWLGLALAAIGLGAARARPAFLGGTALLFALTTLYPLGYDIHDVQQYFLAPFLIVALWIGTGAAAIAARLGAKGGGARPRFAPALLVVPAIALGLHWRAVDRSDDRWVESMAHSFLATPAENAVVLSAHWDVLLSPALYLQRVEGVRPDLALLDQEHFRRTWNLPGLRHHHPDLLAGLDAETERLQDLLTAFERGEPYDPAVIQATFEAVVGGVLENGRRRGGAWVGSEIEPGLAKNRVRIPDGLLLRLDDPDAEAALPPPTDWPDLPDGERPGRHLPEARKYASLAATRSGDLALRVGEAARARRDFQQALVWNPTNEYARRGAAAAERIALEGVAP